jgi:signal transduction histidine kinase
MYERAELIGATLEIISEPGKGALLVVSLPMSNPANTVQLP